MGLALGEEIDTTEGGAWAAGLAPGAPPEARQAALAAFVHSRVCDLYALIEPCMGTGAPFPLPPGCARPWAEPGAQPPLAAAAAR